MPVLPDHPMLAPGVVLARREVGALQVGFEPGPSILLPDGTVTVEALRCLREHRLPDAAQPRVRGLLLRLAADGLIADADHVATAGALGRALASRTGLDAATRVALRTGTRVVLDAPAAWRAAWAADLAACGLDPADDAGEPLQTVALVARPAAALAPAADRWVGEQVPHLLVALGAHAHRVGPFVSPGLTACARCLQAHLVEEDPSRPLVDASADATPVGPESDPVLDLRARVEAVSEIVRWAEGLRPRLWSATAAITLEDEAQPRSWRRHPWCGCAWDELT